MSYLSELQPPQEITIDTIQQDFNDRVNDVVTGVPSSGGRAAEPSAEDTGAPEPLSAGAVVQYDAASNVLDGKKIALQHKQIVPDEYVKRTSDGALYKVEHVSDEGEVTLRPIGPDGEMQEPVLWAFELVHKQLVHTKDRVEVVEDWRKMAPFEQHTATESLVKAYALAALRDTSALHRPTPELRVQLKPQVRVFAKQAHKAFSIYLTPDTHRFVILEEDDETPQHGFVITIPTGTGDDVWRVVPH